MPNFLSQAERESLKAQHKKERDKRICYRINAVKLEIDRRRTIQKRKRIIDAHSSYACQNVSRNQLN